jgi:hypothetical protein
MIEIGFKHSDVKEIVTAREADDWFDIAGEEPLPERICSECDIQWNFRHDLNSINKQ